MAEFFTDLPCSVISSVFSQLHSEDHAAFGALRTTCRKLRDFSETYLLRDITFRGVRDVEGVMFAWFREVGNGVAGKIQRIRLAPSVSRHRAAQNLAAMLETCWRRLTNLQELV